MSREVFWFERYAPPEPGMVLADEVTIADGKRVLMVWRSRTASYQGHICCWSEPEAVAATNAL